MAHSRKSIFGRLIFSHKKRVEKAENAPEGVKGLHGHGGVGEALSGHPRLKYGHRGAIGREARAIW